MYCKIEDDKNVNFSTKFVSVRFAGKTYFVFKFFPRMVDGGVYITTNPSPEHHSTSKSKVKEISEEIKPLREFEAGNRLFDDISGSSKNKHVNQFFVRVKLNVSCIFNLSQSYFASPEKTIGKNSTEIVLFKQTLNDVEKVYKDFRWHDMSYMSSSTEENLSYLYFDRSQKKFERRYCICNGSKIT